MKLLILLVSLFAVAQAQFSISRPSAGATITPGQNVNIQILVPVDTSAYAGQQEISLVIGIVNCGSAACPAASKDLGEIIFVGKYVPQGTYTDGQLNHIENLTLKVPGDISGKASIQVQHNYVLTPPGHSLPNVEYTSVKVKTGSGPVGSTLNVHPNGDNSKCVGILGGKYTNGAAVDIYGCNGSATQKWQWNGSALQSTNTVDGSKWCLDAGVNTAWKAGLKMKIWQCLPNLPQQSWTPITSSGNIKLTTANYCLDLTEGSKADRNVLQIWTCGGGNVNQIWSVTPA